jgi:hypothetical protein
MRYLTVVVLFPWCLASVAVVAVWQWACRKPKFSGWEKFRGVGYVDETHRLRKRSSEASVISSASLLQAMKGNPVE